MMKSIITTLALIIVVAGALMLLKDKGGNDWRVVQLYYYTPANDLDADNNIQCTESGLVPVSWKISARSATPIDDTIRLLLEGAAPDDGSMLGVERSFPLEGVQLLSTKLESGVLTLTLADPEHKTGGGACRIAIMRAQIEATAKQFDGVETIRIEPAELFQP